MRHQGMSMPAIAKALGIHLSTVRWHLEPDRRKRENGRQGIRMTKLRTELGGKCQQCGYAKCQAALQFHHIDPTTKKFCIGWGAERRSWQLLREEVAKCRLLCSNCHIELEHPD